MHYKITSTIKIADLPTLEIIPKAKKELKKYEKT